MPKQGANSSESKKMHWFLLLAERQVNFWGKCKKKTCCYEKWSQMLHMKVMKMMSRKAIMWWRVKRYFLLGLNCLYKLQHKSMEHLHFELIYHNKCRSFLFQIRSFNACLKIWPFSWQRSILLYPQLCAAPQPHHQHWNHLKTRTLWTHAYVCLHMNKKYHTDIIHNI